MTIRRVGVEEEFLLVDPVSGVLRPGSRDVLAEHARRHPGRTGEPQLKHELFLEQVEVASIPCADLTQLAAELRRGRSLAAAGAEKAGCAIVALGTAATDFSPSLTQRDRYQRMAQHHRLLATENLICATQVHVEVVDDQDAVVALDRMRPWLPVLLAISANSPFWRGRDTGYASYRSQVVAHWPSAAQTEPFGTAENYRAVVRELLATTAALDEGMIYFDARVSARFPTLEVRIADACTDVGDTVLVAALTRALVETALRDDADGAVAQPWRTELLRAATWVASRFGLGEDLVHPVRRESRPAFEVLDALVEHVAPALDEAGDAGTVHTLIDGLRQRGTGAARQRASFARRGRLQDVVLDAVERTRGGCA